MALPLPVQRGTDRSEPVTPEDFDALFDRFHFTAYRLETLPSYDVGDIGDEAERIRAIRQHLPVPERSIRTDPWMARIALSTLTQGKTWQRVRVVDEPLTEYQRIELIALVEAQAVGDQGFLVPRSAVGDVPDMWLFDGWGSNAHAVVMDYDEHGHWLGCQLVTPGAELEALKKAWYLAYSIATPLSVFLASNRFEHARVVRA